MKIAIVDDDSMSLKSMYTNLRDEFDIDCFSTPFSLLQLIESGRSYDAIISDYKMDGMDGLTLLTKIKERIELITILYTGFSTAKLKKEVVKGSIDFFIEKPVDIGDLIEKLNRLVKVKL